MAQQIIFDGRQACYYFKNPGRQEAGWVAEIRVHLSETLQGKELPTSGEGPQTTPRKGVPGRGGQLRSLAGFRGPWLETMQPFSTDWEPAFPGAPHSPV